MLFLYALACIIHIRLEEKNNCQQFQNVQPFFQPFVGVFLSTLFKICYNYIYILKKRTNAVLQSPQGYQIYSIVENAFDLHLALRCVGRPCVLFIYVLAQFLRHRVKNVL